jgi:4-amino-4-deoxy-L-arabinose transferase-like glycosyltransferase
MPLIQSPRGARIFSRLKAHQFIVPVAAAIYLFFSLRFLALPGLQYDEVLFTNAALGDIDGSFLHWKIRVGGIHIPVMLMGYIGALKAWIYAPVFALFGTTPAIVRIPVVLIGLLTLAFTYTTTRAMLGRGVATITLVLLASDPSFIFANKLDWGLVSLMLCLKMAALFCLWRWLERGRLFWGGLGSFLLGLGVFDKIVFIWFVVALGVAFTVCYRRQLAGRFDRRTITALGGFFLLGCLPVIAFNVRFPLRTFQGQRIVARDKSWRDDLRYRLGLFETTFDGRAVQDLLMGHERFADVLSSESEDDLGRAVAVCFRRIPLDRTLLAFAVPLAIVVLLGMRRYALVKSRAVMFFVVVLLLLAGMVFATAQATAPQHVLVIYPLGHILVAAALVSVWRSRRSMLSASLVLRARLRVLVLLFYFRSYSSIAGI